MSSFQWSCHCWLGGGQNCSEGCPTCSGGWCASYWDKVLSEGVKIAVKQVKFAILASVTLVSRFLLPLKEVKSAVKVLVEGPGVYLIANQSVGACRGGG